MLDPEYMRRVADGAEQIAAALHEELIECIVERIMARLDRGDDYRLTAVDRWELEVLQDAGYLREDLERVLAERTGLMLQEIADAFEDAAVRSVEWDDEVYRAAGLDPLPLRQSPHLMRLAQRGYEKTAGEWLNFTGTLADESQQIFFRECDKAYHLVSSGGMSYTQAVLRAVDAVAAGGVVVTYPSGHRDTIETATFRAVRTGVGQACGEITEARMDELDWDTVLVSDHLGARTGDGGANFTNHFWLQGKFYSKSGRDKRFPPLSVCGIGYVDGLLGANCRHSIGPGDGEHNPFRGYDSEANRLREELEQRQRLLERRVRRVKRRVQGLKAAVDGAGTDAARSELERRYREQALRLQERNKEYREFCRENELKPYQERLAIARWDRKQAAAASAAARKAERDERGKNERAARAVDEARTKIQRGDFPLEILEGKQAEHMQGTAKEGKSVITVPQGELQRIVLEKAGTGEMLLNRKGEWNRKEIIDAGEEIGYTLNLDGAKIWTRKAKIHYRKTGVHVVPYSGKEDP